MTPIIRRYIPRTDSRPVVLKVYIRNKTKKGERQVRRVRIVKVIDFYPEGTC